MNALQKQQQGASAIGAIIILALIGAGVFVALQYIPQVIEAGTVDTILGSIETRHKETPFNSTKAIQEAIDRQLDINQAEDLRNNFKVTGKGDTYIIQVNYERDLNLLYEKKTLQHDKSVVLKR